MLKNKSNLLTIVITFSWLFNANISAQVPLSDPDNIGNWAVLEEVSDEFEGVDLDRDKWWVVGEFVNGAPVYQDPDNPTKKVWIGRAPSQFSGRNYRLQDGKLILETRWEPDFPFSTTPQADGTVYENLTTPCIIGRRMFQYGYMEIRSKAADAEITSSFWATGNNTEFDFFEMFGDHRQANKLDKDRELWWSIHDWSPEVGGKSVYTEHHDLGFRVADDFHTYGIEWDESGVKYYVDGTLFTQATAAEIDEYALTKGYDKGYVITKAIKIWLDQETFPWHGIPDSKEDLELNSPEGQKDDGIVDFEIEYVRVWQKQPTANLIDDEFFGFESTIDVDGVATDWYVPGTVSSNVSITDTKPSSGAKSLKITHTGTPSANLIAFAPKGTLDLGTDQYELSFKVWLESGSDIKNINVVLDDPWLLIPFDVTGIATNQWVNLKTSFSRAQVSGVDDRIRVLVKPADVTSASGTIYVDEISIIKTLSTDVEEVDNKDEILLFPNPVSDILNISAPDINQVKIISCAGKVVKSYRKESEPFQCSVSDLPKGVYLVYMYSDKDFCTKKVQVK